MSDKSSRKKKKMLLDYWNMDFICSSYCIFLKGLTHDFVQQLEKISSQCDFGQMSLKIMFDDHPSRKQAFLDDTNIDFTQWPYWDFWDNVWGSSK